MLNTSSCKFWSATFPHKYISFNLRNTVKLRIQWVINLILIRSNLSLVLDGLNVFFFFFNFFYVDHFFKKVFIEFVAISLYFFVCFHFLAGACEILGLESGSIAREVPPQSFNMEEIVSLSTLIESACFPVAFRSLIHSLSFILKHYLKNASHPTVIDFLLPFIQFNVTYHLISQSFYQ